MTTPDRFAFSTDVRRHDRTFCHARLRDMLQRVAKGRIIITRPEKLTPFCFPIKVDSLNRETLSSESMEERVKRMILDG